MAELIHHQKEKKNILDSSLFIQIKHTLIGKGVYLFYINNQTKIYIYIFENNKIYYSNLNVSLYRNIVS